MPNAEMRMIESGREYSDVLNVVLKGELGDREKVSRENGKRDCLSIERERERVYSK